MSSCLALVTSKTMTKIFFRDQWSLFFLVEGVKSGRGTHGEMRYVGGGEGGGERRHRTGISSGHNSTCCALWLMG